VHLILQALNPSSPNIDKHLISPYNTTTPKSTCKLKIRLKGLKRSMQNSKASGQNTPRLNFLIAGGGTLLPRIPYGEGFHRLVVRSDQIGLKNVHVYVNPFSTVSDKGN